MSELSRRIAQQQAVQQGPAPGEVSVMAVIEAMKPEFAKVLGERFPVQHFMRLVMTELRQNPQLAKCTMPSLLGSLMTCARLGLEYGGPLGQYYPTPRYLQVKGAEKGVRAWQVLGIIGYQGLRDLAYASGYVDSVQSVLVRMGDTFEHGANETRGVWFDWVPMESEQDDSERPWEGVLAVARIRGAGTVWRYLSKAQVMARKERGSAGDSGPWATDEEAMALKTGIRAIAPDLPKSTRFAEAIKVDEQVQVYRPEAQQQEELPPGVSPEEPPPPPEEPPPAEPDKPAERTKRSRRKPPPDDGIRVVEAGGTQVLVMVRGESLWWATLGTPPQEDEQWHDTGLPVTTTHGQIVTAMGTILAAEQEWEEPR